jgi:hypothetical protein
MPPPTYTSPLSSQGKNGFNFDKNAFMSQLSGMGLGNAMQNFGGGYSQTPNYALNIGNYNDSAVQSIASMLPSGKPTFQHQGMGTFQQQPMQGPSVQQMWGGMLRDLNVRDQLNKQNFERQQNAADMFLNKSNAVAEATKNAATPMFDKAYAFQQQGQQQAAKDFDLFQKQLADADKAMQSTQNQVGQIYNQALGQVGQGIDRVASDAAAAIAQRKASDMDQIMGEIGGFAGTEAQIQEAARQKASGYDRDLFGTMAGIQANAAQQRSAVLQGKAGTFASLGSSLAGMKQSSAKMGFDAAANKNQWNEFGANIAMAHGKLQQDVANNYAQLSNMGYAQYAQMIQQNPVLGVTITPTLLAMSEAAQSYGNQNLARISPISISGGGQPGSNFSYDYGSGQRFVNPTDVFGGPQQRQNVNFI